MADFPSDTASPVDMRREAWKVRARVSHDVVAGFLGRWGLQLRGAEERDDAGLAPVPYRLEMDDVVATVGTRRGILSWLTGELGYGHQRTTVRQDGPDSEQRFTWGTRSENRLYLIAELQTLGLRARFIETIELDDEGYDAVSDHDKGFIQIQADF